MGSTLSLATGDAFDVICPSLPGYAWSGPTRDRGWNIRRVADAMVALMGELGHDRFAVHGGDWGALATAERFDNEAGGDVTRVNIIATPWRPVQISSERAPCWTRI